ncbi:MAG: ribonuclease D [Candidatus Tokpelaia sp.]|nr:MAG: ribonuclease D [Candidatus Tokpelaia sp.]KAA6206097.1 MAG: ribonuclease D [Candidatus Tokpelaia sp.]KAA6405652.1 ribonuclease D [Candidatus Tokpelaia sp.]
MKKLHIHQGDLPSLSRYQVEAVAIDTETMGLNVHRDRLCLVQLSTGDGIVDLVQIAAGQKKAPNLVKLLKDSKITKIFHYARFDMAVLLNAFGAMPQPVFCTKIASRLVRTYTDRHGLKDLCAELLDIQISKQQQSSFWGAENLSAAQQDYAAADVLYLHDLKNILQQRLRLDKRQNLAEECFCFLSARIRLDLAGWAEQDIFAHN